MSDTPRTDAEYQQWETLEEAARFSQELERENAALLKDVCDLVHKNELLREDKERLDLLLINKHCKLSFCWEWLRWTPQQVRCALDAERIKRKEAQP